MGVLDLNNPTFYIIVILSIFNGITLCLVSTKLFQIVQLSGYKFSGYKEWLKDTKIKFVSRLFMLSFLSLISILVTNSLLDGFDGYYSYVGLIFYAYFCIVFIINIAKSPQKSPLKQTKRMNRLIAVTFVCATLISFGLISVVTEYIPFIKYGILVVTPLLMPILVPFVNLLLTPIETLARKTYLVKASNKLEKMPDLIKIGITGSYGKTSTKHILNVMLSKKYSVCMTPHSFNTPMGLTKVVLKYLQKKHQILIAEMGARNVGDIKYLCKLINPKHAIITSVGSQHMSTFKSKENIAKTKYELVEHISDGFVVFNGNSKGSKSLFDKCDKNKFLSGVNIKNGFCDISEVKLDKNGTEFKLTINSESVMCKTSMVGKYILENIATSATLAYKLGVSLKQIQESIEELKPTPHRMEISQNNGLTIIDNSYNSSQESSVAALDILKLFEEGRKIIVTPGLVEMGYMEEGVNILFGEQIADVCDIAIIVNKSNKQAIKEGLENKKFNQENIYCVDTLNEVKVLLPTITQKNDVVLFQNDLPDNYT